jgi:hypothetical protein
MAKRMGAKTIEVKSSRLSLISHPDEITRQSYDRKFYAIRSPPAF